MAKQNLKTLIVDDEYSNRVLLQLILAPIGDCWMATSGLEAVEQVDEQLKAGKNFDLILLDIMMPNMDGQVALKKIREMESQHDILPGAGAKIIMVTALRDAKNIMTAFQEQCETYLVKPIERELLLNELVKLKLIESI